AMNIQTSRQTKSSPYALVFGQNPLRHFTILKEIKDRHINSEDELPENWFELSEPQDDFDQQEVVESLLGATALNVEEQQWLEHEFENEILDEEIMNEKLDKIEDEKISDNTVDKRLDERLSKRINERSYEKLNIRVTEKENMVINIKDEAIDRSLLENEAVGRRLPENMSDIRPSKRHKLILMPTTTDTNTQ
ncbi:1715_t:CDS:2, partial [Cetraspora pellucida]